VEHKSDRLSTLVVARDSNINPVKFVISIAKSKNGNVHVRGLNDSLVVAAGVTNDDKSRLKVLLGVLVSKGTWNPLSTEVFSTGISGELEDSSLSIRAVRNDKNVLLAFLLNSGNNSGSEHNLLPGLVQIHVVDSVLVSLVNVWFHVLGAVLGTEVNLGSKHVQKIVFLIFGV